MLGVSFVAYIKECNDITHHKKHGKCLVCDRGMSIDWIGWMWRHHRRNEIGMWKIMKFICRNTLRRILVAYWNPESESSAWMNHDSWLRGSCIIPRASRRKHNTVQYWIQLFLKECTWPQVKANSNHKKWSTGSQNAEWQNCEVGLLGDLNHYHWCQTSRQRLIFTHKKHAILSDDAVQWIIQSICAAGLRGIAHK